jgi:DNA replication protein DnaC
MDSVPARPPRTTSVAAGSFGAQSPCPYEACDGTGYLLDEETGLAHPCRCREARVAAARAGALERRIPRRFRDVAFERWPVTEIEPRVVGRVRDFAESVGERLDRGESLALYGPKRSGKTTLAMLVSKHVLAANRTVAIYTLPRLLTEIRETYNDRSERTYGELMRQLAMVDLLHVDDMAVMEQPNPWVLEQLYTIVNTRYEDERSMLITADVPDLRELEGAIGARTAWRLIEMSHPVAVPDPTAGANDAVRGAA